MAIETVTAHNVIASIVALYGQALADQQAKLDAANVALAAAGKQLRASTESVLIPDSDELSSHRVSRKMLARLVEAVALWDTEEEGTSALQRVWTEYEYFIRGEDVEAAVGDARRGDVPEAAVGQGGRAGADPAEGSVREVQGGSPSPGGERAGEGGDQQVRPAAPASRPDGSHPGVNPPGWVGAAEMADRNVGRPANG